MKNQQKSHEFSFVRRLRAVNTTLQILFSIGLALAINYLAANYYKRYDITSAAKYSLAAESKAYIQELTEEVHIIITLPNDSDIPEIARIQSDLRKLTREYQANARRKGKAYINVEFVDIHRQRGRARELINRYGIEKENVLFVASADKVIEIELPELYNATEGKPSGFRGEQAITSAILEVTNEKAPKLYFLSGHGEMRIDSVDPLRGLSQMGNFLRERSYICESLDLTLSDGIPEDADLVIIAAPQASLLPEEVDILRRYLRDRNGRLIIFLDPGRLHGMDDLFYDWGVMVEDLAVIDIDPKYRTQSGDLIIRHFSKHPISNLLLEYAGSAYFGQPRPIRIDPLAKEDPRLRVDYLIGTSKQSWAERDFRTQAPLQYDADRDIPGPISIATASMRSARTELGISIPGGRVVTFGNSDFIANNRFKTYGNYTLFINAVNWSLNRSKLLNISTRPLESYEIIMSQSALQNMLATFAVLPGVIALVGLSIYLIRRR